MHMRLIIATWRQFHAISHAVPHTGRMPDASKASGLILGRRASRSLAPRCTRLQAPRGRVRPTPRCDARTRPSATMSRSGTAGPRRARALPLSSLSTNSRSSVTVAAPGCCHRSACGHAVEIDAGVDIVHVTLSQAARVNTHGERRSGACMVGHGCEVEWVARVARQGVARSAEHMQ